MLHNGREKGKHRKKVQTFLKYETIYLLEHIARQQGIVRTDTGEPIHSATIERIVDYYVGVNNYTTQQREQMYQYQLKLESSRK